MPFPIPTLTDRRRKALLSLLEDDSPRVWEAVLGELLALGPAARPLLRAAEGSDSARLRSRARRVLAENRRQEVLRRILSRGSRGRLDLESGLFLLARLERPELDARPHRRRLDALGRRVAERAERQPQGLARAMALVQHLGGELGFAGPSEDFHHPLHIHLPEALERHRGLPLTLTAIYLLVARRASIPAAAVALPGRVLLRLYPDEQARRRGRSLLVDPFAGGALRTRAECRRYLRAHGLADDPRQFADASDGQLFRRQLRNLARSAELRGLERRARQLYRVARHLDQARRPPSAKPAPAPSTPDRPPTL